MKRLLFAVAGVLAIAGAWAFVPIRFYYREGRPTRLGRISNRLMGWWSATGLPPSFQAGLEVPGRVSGEPRTNPVVIATVGGERYLVSMLGPGSEWVRNVEAAGGRAAIRHGRRDPVTLVPVVDPAARAPVLREYCRIATSGRRHFPLAKDAPLADFEAIADRYPVYRIELR